MYLLAITTGMRLGELLGLRWQDVDLDQREVVVQMSAHRVPGGLVLAETKTQFSRRKIALSHSAVRALREHRRGQHTERLVLGSHWDTSLDLVFPNTVGRIQHPRDLVQGAFKNHLLRLGLPEIRFHDLRHTAATLLLARGVHVKVVSELLGHSDIAITLRVYGHVLPHMHGIAADVMDTMLAG